MKFRRKKESWRLRTNSKKFFKEVHFKNRNIAKQVKKVVLDWMLNLQEFNGIKVSEFKNLFYELNEVSFPIVVKESYNILCLDITFVDAEGKEYYMSAKDLYRPNYEIGREDSVLEPMVDRDFVCEICSAGFGIILESNAVQLNQDEADKEIIINFKYNPEKHSTDVVARVDASKEEIRIIYPIIYREMDKVISELLFNCASETSYYYDVFPIFKWLADVIMDEYLSATVTAKLDGEIYAEIDAECGEVIRNIYSEVINENEIIVHKEFYQINLTEFLN